MKIVDFHCHLFLEEFLTNEFKKMLNNFAMMLDKEEFPVVDSSPEKYLELIEPKTDVQKKFPINQAIIYPIDYTFTRVKFKISYEDYLKFVVRTCDEHKGFFYSLVGPDPRHGSKALEIIDNALGQEPFKGLILTPSTGFSLDDPLVDKMVQKAGEYKVPVVIHDPALVPPPLELFTDFKKLEQLISRFMDQLFIICPFSQMDQLLMRAVIRHRNHIMVDNTGYDSQYIGQKIPDMFFAQFFAMLKETFGSQRIIFGSDWPWWEATVPIQKWLTYVRKMKLPIFLSPFGLPTLKKKDKENILGLNAQRILNLP